MKGVGFFWKPTPRNFSESLILAQSERWRRGLGMQVERLKTVSKADRKEGFANCS